MRAITIPTPGGPEAFELAEVPTPEVGSDSVLVKVVAAGVNRADVLQRQGFYNPPADESEIPGLEVAGTIVEVGAQVTGWKVGDRVAALLTGGGYAEYVDVPAGQLFAVPAGLDFAKAAALPEVLCTVYSNVIMAAGLQAGEWLLVHGGGSGIGTAAIQIAKAYSAHVAVTVGSERKAQFCRELGADATINYREEDFVERIREITAEHTPRDDSGNERHPGADVIFDVVGAKYLQRNVDALSTDGRLVIIGLQGGVKAEINLNELMRKRRTVMGTTLRARPLHQKAEIVTRVAQDLWPLVERGEISPIVFDTLPLAEAGRAHTLLEDGTSIGKVILKVSDE